MLEKESVKLTPIAVEDLGFLVSLRQDPVIFNNLGSFFLPNMEKQKKWFKSLSSSDQEYLLISVKSDGDWHRAGLVRVTQIDFLNRSACVGADLHKEFRGRGLANIVYDLVFDLTFNRMNLHRIWLLVLETNFVAKKLYQKLGFRYEGTQRQAIFSDGRYLDYEMYSILKEEFKS